LLGNIVLQKIDLVKRNCFRQSDCMVGWSMTQRQHVWSYDKLLDLILHNILLKNNTMQYPELAK